MGLVRVNLEPSSAVVVCVLDLGHVSLSCIVRVLSWGMVCIRAAAPSLRASPYCLFSCRDPSPTWSCASVSLVWVCSICSCRVYSTLHHKVHNGIRHVALFSFSVHSTLYISHISPQILLLLRSESDCLTLPIYATVKFRGATLLYMLFQWWCDKGRKKEDVMGSKHLSDLRRCTAQHVETMLENVLVWWEEVEQHRRDRQHVAIFCEWLHGGARCGATIVFISFIVGFSERVEATRHWSHSCLVWVGKPRGTARR